MGEGKTITVPAGARITLVPKIVIEGDRRDEEIEWLRRVYAAASRFVDVRREMRGAVREEDLGGREVQDLNGAIRDYELKKF